MKIVFAAFNAKYVHTALAVRYLRGYAASKGLSECYVREYTINMQTADVISSLYNEKSDVYSFSMYIFNREFILKVISSLKKLLPLSTVICGGPEASSDDELLLRSCPDIDFISLGEGERVLTKLLLKLRMDKAGIVKDDYLKNGGEGVSFINNGKFERLINTNPVCNLDEIPFPYSDEELEALSERIIYYETSRGCPFFCTYCSSGNDRGVRSFSEERIYRDLSVLLSHRLRQVKLVDRTFNYDRERAVRIMQYIALHDNGVTNFHLEIAQWLLDDRLLDFLDGVPRHLFRFEAGIQTTNADTLRAINRHVPLEAYKARLARLIDMGFVVHLDLIAGLPYENYKSFGRSFDEVIALMPDELQLGFLKVLKGTAIAESKEHMIISASEPPYVVLYNRYISFEELERLRRIERLEDRLFNGGLCRKTLFACAEYAFNGSFFKVFECLEAYFSEHNMFEVEWQTGKIYETVFGCVISCMNSNSLLLDALVYDYFLFGKSSALPEWVVSCCVCDRTLLTDTLKNPDILLSCMNEAQKTVFSAHEAKKWFRNSELVSFSDGRKVFFLYDNCLSKDNRTVNMQN